MYHKVGRGKYSNSKKMMRAHLEYISSKYRTVLPGETLKKGFNLCLTFDDATIDFYEKVFPWLKELDLKAVLAVPTDFVGRKGHCTWEMLDEMARSDRVAIACHSHTHVDLSKEGNLLLELQNAKEILENQLKRRIDTFVYPYGRWSRSLQKEVKKHFPYAMRIGSATQRSWKGLMCRIPADKMPHPHFPFTSNVLAKAIFKSGLHKLLRK